MASRGGCFCGAVRYEATSAPLGSMVCHCQTCRRVAAAPVVAWVSFERSAFAFVKGKPGTFHSSAPITRTFCRDCGTPLTYERADSPDSLDVATCSLDDPNAFPPSHHSWLSHDLSWVRFGDGRPTFQKSRNDKS